MRTIINATETPISASQDDGLARLLSVITTSLDEDKAENVVVLDLTGRAGFAERMVIATGMSERQISSMAQHLETRLKEEKLARPQVEGEQGSDWVLMDAGDVVVHLFMPESRELYALERMWGGDFEAAGEEITIG